MKSLFIQRALAQTPRIDPRPRQGTNDATHVPTPDDWNAAMLEVLTKPQGHHDQAWNFIKRAGVELHSNFGLMFDPETGQDYAPDDPRRR